MSHALYKNAVCCMWKTPAIVPLIASTLATLGSMTGFAFIDISCGEVVKQDIQEAESPI